MDKAFIDVINPEDAEGTLARAYRRVGGKRGSIAHIHQSQSLNPKAMMAHLDFYMTVMYHDSPLSRRQRELVATMVSYYNNCEYCIIHHYEALLSQWDDAPKPEKIENSHHITEFEKILLRFAKKLTLDPDSITDTDYHQLKEAGLTDRAVLDLTLVIGYFNFVNRLVIGTGVKLESEGERSYKY